MKNLGIFRHPIVSNAAIFAASQYIAAGLGLLATVVVARILGPNDYGIAALVMAYPMLVWSFIGIKSVSVTTRYISNFRATGRNEEIQSIAKLGYGLDFFLSLVTFILVSTTVWWVTRHIPVLSGKAWLMTVYAASFPLLSLTGTSWAVLSSWGIWRWLAALNILDKVIMFVVLSGLLLKGFGMGGVVIGTAVGHIIFGLLMIGVATYILCREGIGLWWKAPLRKVMSLGKELTGFFGWHYLLVSLNGLIGQVPLMFLGYLRSPEEAGFYRLALTITTAGSYFTNSLGWVVYPILSARWGEGERESLKNSLKRWTLRGLPVGIILLLMIPLCPIVIPLVFGFAYNPMVAGTQWILAEVALSAVFFWLSPFYYSTGRVDLWTKVYALYTAIVLGLGWFCIRWWGFFGLAILITVAKVIFTLVMALGFQESPLRRHRQDEDTISNHKIACFSLRFSIHDNPRYAELFPKLTPIVKFYEMVLSRQRIIRALQRRFIYPVMLQILGKQHETLFTVDVYQIPAWPRKKGVVVDTDDPIFSPTEARLLNLPQVKAIIVTTEKAKTIFQQLGVIRPIYVIAQGISMEHVNFHKTELIREQRKEKGDLIVGYSAPTLTLSSDNHRRGGRRSDDFATLFATRQGLDNLDLLFAATEEARKSEPRLKLWLLGAASKAVKDYAAHKPWAQLFGYIPFSEILNYISNFDIGVYPRMLRLPPGRFSWKIAQYMSCGIPIISTDVDEAFILQEAQCGIICASQEEFSKALVELARSVEMRLELGKRGQEYAATNLDWSMLVERYKQILSQF